MALLVIIGICILIGVCNFIFMAIINALFSLSLGFWTSLWIYLIANIISAIGGMTVKGAIESANN